MYTSHPPKSLIVQWVHEFQIDMIKLMIRPPLLDAAKPLSDNDTPLKPTCIIFLLATTFETQGLRYKNKDFKKYFEH